MTGLLVALLVVASMLLGENLGGAFEWVGLVLGLPVYGLMLGGTLGGVAGLPGGLVNAWVQPSVRGDRAAWWSTWAVATLTAAALVGGVAGWQSSRDVVEADLAWAVRDGLGAGAVALVPALVGGWLTARTGRGLRARTAQVGSGAGSWSERRK